MGPLAPRISSRPNASLERSKHLTRLEPKKVRAEDLAKWRQVVPPPGSTKRRGETRLTVSVKPGVVMTPIPEAEENRSGITARAQGRDTQKYTTDKTLPTGEGFEQGGSSRVDDSDKTADFEQGQSRAVNPDVLLEEETQNELDMEEPLERIMGTLGLDTSTYSNRFADALLSSNLSSVSISSLSSRETIYSHASSRTKSFDYGLHYTRRSLSLESLSSSLSMDFH